MATQNMWQSANPATVGSGGTGDSSLSPAYSVLCSGTTTTGSLQPVASVGTTGQVLTSNGAALPTWTTVTESTGAMVLIQTQSTSGSNVVFNTGISSTYRNYYVTLTEIIPVTNGSVLTMDVSSNGGSSYVSTNYFWTGYFLNGASPTVYTSNHTTASGTGDSSFTLGSLPSNGISNTIGLYASMWLFNFNGSGNLSYYGTYFQLDGTSANNSGFLCGVMAANFVGNAIRFKMSGLSGFLSGTISIYGILE